MRKWPIPVRTKRAEALPLFEEFHGYKGMPKAGAVWGCWEGGRLVAAFCWQPPAYGAAKSLNPKCPAGVLALSRMVAIPKSERDWHISKPLRWLMRRGLDRTRYPLLVTYSDDSLGHTGHVYKCSGWRQDGATETGIYEDSEGVRRAPRSNGGKAVDGLTRVGSSIKVRWVHGEPLDITELGWRQEPTGRVWRSGNPAMRWVKTGPK